MDNSVTENVAPKVGIFWFVGSKMVASGCGLEAAEVADDWLDYPGGHAEHWDEWRAAGSAWLKYNGMPVEILSSEYDEHPRGRIVYDRRKRRFLLYADRRLQTSGRLAEICGTFALPDGAVDVLSDPHYR